MIPAISYLSQLVLSKLIFNTNNLNTHFLLLICFKVVMFKIKQSRIKINITLRYYNCLFVNQMHVYTRGVSEGIYTQYNTIIIILFTSGNSISKYPLGLFSPTGYFFFYEIPKNFYSSYRKFFLLQDCFTSQNIL